MGLLTDLFPPYLIGLSCISLHFLALLRSKIGPLGCPHAVLIPRWANTATVQTSYAGQLAEEESHFFFPPPHTILPLPRVVTSILPMSHQGASGPVQDMCNLYFPLKWAPIVERGGGFHKAGWGYVWAHGNPSLYPIMIFFANLNLSVRISHIYSRHIAEVPRSWHNLSYDDQLS